MLRHFQRILKAPYNSRVSLSGLTPDRIDSPSNFSGREKETEFFTQHLNQEVGQLFVVTGPPNCGKTALLSKVLSDPNRRCVNWDLRRAMGGSFSNLYSCMSRESSYSVSGEPTNAKIFPEPFSREPSNAGFRRALDQLSHYLVDGSSGDRPKPVFWIDEAHLLKAYSKQGGCDAESDSALQSLLTWCVGHSKQMHDFHVVLSSWAPWFTDYLTLRHSVEQFSVPLVISDLCKEEARKYFESLVSKNVSASLASQAPHFDSVYAVLGGRAPSLVKYVRMAIATGSFDDGLLQGPVLQAIDTFRSAFTPSQFRTDSSSVAECGVPQWTRYDLFKVMELLVRHNGCVPVGALASEVPKSSLKSLMNHNLLGYLPTTDGVPCLEGAEAEGPVYIPVFPEHLCAMKNILAK